MRSALPIALAALLSAAMPAHAKRPLLFVGQDIASVAAYIDSGCCGRPDGVTTYIGFYDLLSPDAHFGGTGMDAAGRPAADADWGAGPINALATARRFGTAYIAIGLDISEGAHPGGLAAIASGRHDDKVDQLARLLRAMGRTVALRIGYEFDGAWNKGYDDRRAYVAAWRHIVDRLRVQGAGDVRFVWQGSASPMDDLIEGGRREEVGGWYPGDAYVDWVGLSWFLPPDARPGVPASLKLGVPTQRMLADELVRFARDHRKPVMIAESAPQGIDIVKGEHRAISPIWDGAAGTRVERLGSADVIRRWYAPYARFLRANADIVAAVAYINADWDAQPMWGKPYAAGYWGDSRIEAAPWIAKWWRRRFR